MNVWKYIYIKFYKFRRWGLGKTLGEDYAAMLFVASFDVLLYFGILQSPNQKIPDRKTKCVIKTHINIKQNVIFGAKLKPV